MYDLSRIVSIRKKDMVKIVNGGQQTLNTNDPVDDYLGSDNGKVNHGDKEDKTETEDCAAKSSAAVSKATYINISGNESVEHVLLATRNTQVMRTWV